MAKIHQVAMMLMLPVSIAAAQQSITLNDGSQYSGRFVAGTENSITFVDQNGGRHRFNMDEVRSITFNGNGGYGRNDNNSNTRNDSDRQYRDDRRRNGRDTAYNRSDNNDRGNNSADRGNYAVLPSETEVSVRTVEAINAKEVQPNRMYAATIARDVVGQNGNVVIPRGSDAQLTVRDGGNGQILLDVNSVSVNGQRYFLSTQDVSQDNKGSNRGVGANRRTGTYVGGGAALGTLLGAIGGGGKGALIGAIAGAAAGAGAQVLTKGSEVRVPSETVLNFKLDQPVYLYQ